MVKNDMFMAGPTIERGRTLDKDNEELSAIQATVPDGTVDVPELAQAVDNLEKQIKRESGFQGGIQLGSTIGEVGKVVTDNANIQSQAIGEYLTEQIDENKNNLDVLRQTYQNRKKMTEINNYYSDRYEAQTNMMKKISLISILLMITIFIKTRNIVPENVMNAAIILILILGGLYIVWLLIDFYRRDNTNFDEYKFPNMPEYEPSDGESISEYNKRNFILPTMGQLGGELGLGCMGESCCEIGPLFTSLDVGKEITIGITDNDNQNTYISDGKTYYIIWTSLPQGLIDPIEEGTRLVIESVNPYKNGDVKLKKISVDDTTEDEIYVLQNPELVTDYSLKYDQEKNKCIVVSNKEGFSANGRKSGGGLKYASF